MTDVNKFMGQSVEAVTGIFFISICSTTGAGLDSLCDSLHCKTEVKSFNDVFNSDFKLIFC